MASVVEDGPAAKAGIQEGDVITKLDDDEITSADGLIIALRSHEVGEKVEITLMRGKDEKKARSSWAPTRSCRTSSRTTARPTPATAVLPTSSCASIWMSC